MTRKLIPFAALVLASLAGCAASSGGSRAANGDASSLACDASQVESVVGQTVTSELVEESRKRANAESARPLRPDDVITMEYDPQRLNLRVDEQDTVISVNCS